MIVGKKLLMEDLESRASLLRGSRLANNLVFKLYKDILVKKLNLCLKDVWKINHSNYEAILQQCR